MVRLCFTCIPITHHKLIPAKQSAVGKIGLGDISTYVQCRVVNCHVTAVHFHNCSKLHCLHSLRENDVSK